MNKSISPFTTTPGIAGPAYINTHCADEIIDNFESAFSTQYVYKILGLRGSGKSVEYKRIMDHFSGKDNWKVYGLSSGGAPAQTLLSAISREKEVNSASKTTETTASGTIGGNLILASGSTSISRKYTSAPNPNYYSQEDELEKMCMELCHQGYSILIGIDDIAVSEAMIEFLSIVGKFLLNPDINIRLVTTGLEKNIEQFVEVPHLSFFARPKPYIITTLNLNDVARMYQKLLGINTADARALAELSRGYAWGYQLLGDIYYGKSDSDSLDDILREFDSRMASTYDLIWNTLTPSEREMVRIIVNSKTGLRSEIEPNVSGYSQHRQGLKKKHIIDTSVSGSVRINLPRFKEYIENEW